MEIPGETPNIGLTKPKINAMPAFCFRPAFKKYLSFFRPWIVILSCFIQTSLADGCVCVENVASTVSKRGHTAAGDRNSKSGLRDFIGIASYAPVALYAENLRVPKALVQSIVTPLSVSPCLTGCIKDLEWLWNIDAQKLFGWSSNDTDSYVTATMRNGNEYPLANATLLKMIKLIDKRSPTVFYKSPRDEASRPTTVNVTFLTPTLASTALDKGSRKQIRLLMVVLLTVFLQCAVQLSAAVLAAFHGLELECLLLAIPTVNLLLLSLLRLLVVPKFALAAVMARDVLNTYRGGAAIDAHIVSRNWNSSHIDVLCGYSSHLHSLTNIPVKVTRQYVLLWVGRILAVTLSTQAAALAYVVGRTGTIGLAAVSWLALYVIMLFPQILMERIWPMERYETYVGSVEFAGTAIFSNRRPALAFLAMLPVNYRTKRWDWVNVFMPENERRIEWQKDLETCSFIGGSTRPDRRVSKDAEFHLEQARKAYNQLRKNGSLDRFEKSVLM